MEKDTFSNIKSKIINPKKIGKLIFTLKKENKKLIFTNGCFDIIHRGHLEYLAKAKDLGDILIVALNTDDSIKKLKGEKRPINKLGDRLLSVASLFFVDYVTFFDEITPIKIISIIQPDIHVKGGDYIIKNLPEYDIIKSYGGTIKIINFIEGYSTSSIIEKIIKKGVK